MWERENTLAFSSATKSTIHSIGSGRQFVVGPTKSPSKATIRNRTSFYFFIGGCNIFSLKSISLTIPSCTLLLEAGCEVIFLEYNKHEPYGWLEQEFMDLF